MGSTIWVIKGDARSLEYSSYRCGLGRPGFGFHGLCVRVLKEAGLGFRVQTVGLLAPI